MDLAFSEASQQWDFLYSSDAAHALVEIGKNSINGGIYVIGSGIIHPLKDFIKIITNKFDINPTQFFGLIPSSNSSLNHLEADINKLQNEFNWKPKIDFIKGIDLTIDYCKNSSNH